jgi:polyhydroxyalkanoate synthesis repressor PhaR
MIIAPLPPPVKRESKNNMDNKIIIKKYENRRLYDTTHSRYVNLDEVARAVQNGYEVQVLDASSGEDITRLIMTQIIVESAKGPNSAFPLDVLRQMVVASGKASQESTLKYMRAMADMYKDTMRGFTQTMSPFEVMQKMMNSASHAQVEPAAPVAEADPTSEPQASKPQESTVETEVQELRRRIQELEAMVLKSDKAPSPQADSIQPEKTPKKRARNQPSS